MTSGNPPPASAFPAATPDPSRAHGGADGGGVPLTRSLALRVVTMPRDTNQYGTIFGGVILSYIDQAAFVEARRHGVHRWVTASLDRVDFKAPVGLGDTVNFYTCTTRVGTKSVTVSIEVEAERYASHDRVLVTSAAATMVSVDSQGVPIPFRTPPTA